MAAKTMSLVEQMQSDLKARNQKIGDLDKKRIKLEEEDKQNLDQYESNLQRILSGKQEADVQALSKLDQGIERGKQYKGEISELAESLTTELNDLGQFFGNMSQYKGFLESGLSKLGFTKLADKSRLQRVKSSDVKQNLETILDYGHHMVNKLYSAILENMECHARIDVTIRTTAEELQKNQPIYEQYRSQRELLERQIKELADKMDQSGEAEYATLAGKKAELDKNLQEIRINENHHFTIVNKAKQALPIQTTHLKAYADIVESLTGLKTGLEQDIQNVTQLYLSVPTAIKTALSTKAASQYDKGMKYATDKSTEVVLASVAGVLNESAGRAERPLIEPQKLEGYRKAQLEMRAEYDSRVSAIKKKYAAPGSGSE